MLYIPKSLYDLNKFFGFLLNFSESWKSCVKEQWPKKALFKAFDLTSWFVTRGQKRVKYIWYPQIMTVDWVRKGHMNLIMFSVFGEHIKRLISKQSKLNFRNRLHQQLHLYAVCLHKQPPDDQTIQLGHQVSKQFWKHDQHSSIHICMTAADSEVVLLELS